jgi:hypothetical protein
MWVQDRDKWLSLVNTIMNFRFHKTGEFLTKDCALWGSFV